MSTETKTWEADKAIRYSKAVNHTVSNCIGRWITGIEEFAEEYENAEEEEEESESESDGSRKRKATSDVKTPLTSKRMNELRYMFETTNSPENKHFDWVKKVELPFGVLGLNKNQKFLAFIDLCGLEITCLPVVIKLNCQFGDGEGDYESYIYPFRDEDIAYYCKELKDRPIIVGCLPSTPFFGPTDQTWEENEDMDTQANATKKGVYIAHAAVVHEKSNKKKKN